MSHKDANSQVSVPFSWELKPGVSKAKHHRFRHRQESPIFDARQMTLLPPPPPPPPCPSKNYGAATVFSFYHHYFPYPLPSSALKAPSSSKSSFKKAVGYHQAEQDPFLAAYMKCTESSDNKSEGIRRNNNKMVKKINNGSLVFSCKYSCAVASDNLIRMSHIPVSAMKGGK